jgi:YesN/AraC family two-component response regulator
VDDEAWMCEGLKKIIHTHCDDFVVSAVAKDGSQALALLESSDFQLVITDIGMPKMDGIELMKQMHMKKLNIPVILFTGHSEFEYAKQAIRYGALDYLLKPLDKEELLEALEAARNTLKKPKVQSTDMLSPSMDEFTKGKEFIDLLKIKVQSDFQEDLSVTELAEQAGFSSSYICRLFKLEVGKSFVQYLTEIRMEHACKLLSQTNLSVAQIAKRVGYWDVKHFSKMFKREVGVTPVEYRKSEGTSGQ